MIPTNLWIHSTFDLIVFSISIISFVKHRTWIFNAWIVSFWFAIIEDFWMDNYFNSKLVVIILKGTGPVLLGQITDNNNSIYFNAKIN